MLADQVATVLLVRFDRRSDLAPIVRAALEGEVVYLALPSPPPPGRHTLQLEVDGVVVASLGAELVGSARNGTEYPLRVRPLDPAHLPELDAIGARADASASKDAPLSASGPKPSRRPYHVDDEKTLTSETPRGGVTASRLSAPGVRAGQVAPAAVMPAMEEERTLSSRTPEEVGEAKSPSSRPDEIVATTVFDPDALSHAPASAQKPNDDESLTLPRTPSTSGMPRVRPPVRPQYFSDEETQTLPGSSRMPGAMHTPSASWNVRIAPKTKHPLTGRVISGGKYVLESVIGEGAIGIVFKASHKDLGRTVAVKVLNPRYRDEASLLEIFRAEARAASLLEHPNVARVYDYGLEPDGLVYIVMEYLSGYTLGNVLAARKKLTPARAVDIMVQVCAALSAAHDRDIVHRDVKPDNIVLVPSQDDEGKPIEVVKVCDFGIAAIGSSAQAPEDHAAGTPEYMAPEQSTGSAVTPAADVYSCGVVLFEMLCGEVPFTADQPFRILMKHRSEAPRRPSALTPGLSPELEAIVLRCMDKAPARRFRTARDLRAALRKLAAAQA